MSEEIEETPVPAFEPYALEVPNRGTYTVLEPEEATAHRVEQPDGQVIAVPVADSAVALTEAALAAHLANPPTFAPVPAVVTRWQLYRALIALHDIGYEDVLTTIEASPMSDADKKVAVSAVRAAGSYRRDDPLIAGVGALFSLSGAQLDTIFIEAGKLD